MPGKVVLRTRPKRGHTCRVGAACSLLFVLGAREPKDLTSCASAKLSEPRAWREAGSLRGSDAGLGDGASSVERGADGVQRGGDDAGVDAYAGRAFAGAVGDEHVGAGLGVAALAKRVLAVALEAEVDVGVAGERAHEGVDGAAGL